MCRKAEKYKNLARLSVEQEKEDSNNGMAGMIKNVMGNMIPGMDLSGMDMKNFDGEEMKGFLGGVINPDIADKVVNLINDNNSGEKEVSIDSFFDIITPTVNKTMREARAPNGVHVDEEVLENNTEFLTPEKIERLKNNFKDISSIMTDM